MRNFIWLFLIQLAMAGNIIIYDKEYVFRSCNSVIWYQGSFCMPRNLSEESYEPLESYECYCSNKNGLATLMGCLAVEGQNNDAMYKKVVKECAKYGAQVSTSDLSAAYQTYLKDAKDVYGNKSYDMSKPVDYPIKLLDKQSVIISRDTYHVFFRNFNYSLSYGGICLAYWALMVVGAFVCNWVVYLFPNLRLFLNGPISRTYRRYVEYPALLGKKRNVPQRFLYFFEFLIPTRAESLIVFGFFAVCVILCAVNIDFVEGQQLYPGKQAFITRMIVDRTGIMCSMLTPLFFLFAGRNNILQWITGWKYSTMIIYHRWIARIAVTMAFIHSVGFTWIYSKEKYYTTAMKEAWLRWGVVATTCGGLICFQGLLFFRRRFYETFLVLHILLAVFWVVGMWHHLKAKDYQQLVYPAIAVWGLDRVLRVLRLFWFGMPVAQVTWLLDDTLKVEVPKPKSWPSVPGGHAWLHFGYGMYIFQSHPFTFIDSPTKENTIVFFCKVKGGITKTLVKALHEKPGKTMPIRVTVDGPYGETSPVKHHSSIVYVAGGSGVSGVYSEAMAMSRKLSTTSKRVRLVWILRDFVSVAGFTDEIKATRNSGLLTSVYITQPEATVAAKAFLERNNLSSLDEKTRIEEKVRLDEKYGPGFAQEEKQGMSQGSDNSRQDAFGLAGLEYEFPDIDFHVGRPDLNALIARETEQAPASIAFIGCGHPILIDDLRYSIIEYMDKTDKRIDFYEQLQVWA